MHHFLIILVSVAVAFGRVVQDDFTAIINGNLASIEDYPFYAFLSSDGEHLHCGGAFIRRNLVLTAAHCLEDSDFMVYPGIETLEDLKSATAYAVKAIKPHPEFFEKWDSAYDIGLVKLKKKITLGDKVGLIPPTKKTPPIGAETTVVGFGTYECTNFYCRSPSSHHLRSAVITVSEVKDDGVIHTTGENQNTCYGDSGGPIVYDGKIVGLVSTGEVFNCSGYDIQSPVAQYYKWIHDEAKKL